MSQRNLRGECQRVLHVVGAMNVGGAETMLMNLFRRVDRNQLQFDFLCYSDSEGVFDQEIQDLGGRLHRLPTPRARGIKGSLRDLRETLHSAGPYLAVHSHVLHASALAMKAAADVEVPLRITHSHSTDDFHTGWERAAYERWSRWVIARYSTDLVACGEEAGRYLFKDRTFTVINNGVDLERFRVPTAQERVSARLELGVRDGLALAVIARLDPVKNHEFVLDVAQELKEAGISFRLLVVGEGVERVRLEAGIRSRNLESDVQMLGLRHDIPQILAGLDALLLPSHHEGAPVVLMEAQAVGVNSYVSTSVSPDVDLGLGLVEFLPTSNPSMWASRVATDQRHRVERSQLRESLRSAGADIDLSLDRLMDLYRSEARRC